MLGLGALATAMPGGGGPPVELQPPAGLMERVELPRGSSRSTPRRRAYAAAC
jgi:hypothetical protein